MPVTQGTIPGFREVARYWTVAILEQVAPPRQYGRLPEDGREPPQTGLDEKLDPGVQAH
jgi:hypothetical protein